jgi:hypothetical protein
MEIDKLIKRLKSLHNALKEEGEQKYSPEINTVAFVLMDAASALSTLQAENEKLWTGLKSNVDLVFRQAKELDRRHLLLQEQEAELEQVKRERDAAVEDLHKLCPAWKWDGQKED